MNEVQGTTGDCSFGIIEINVEWDQAETFAGQMMCRVQRGETDTTALQTMGQTEPRTSSLETKQEICFLEPWGSSTDPLWHPNINTTYLRTRTGFFMKPDKRPKGLSFPSMYLPQYLLGNFYSPNYSLLNILSSLPSF